MNRYIRNLIIIFSLFSYPVVEVWIEVNVNSKEYGISPGEWKLKDTR